MVLGAFAVLGALAVLWSFVFTPHRRPRDPKPLWCDTRKATDELRRGLIISPPLDGLDRDARHHVQAAVTVKD